MITINYDPFNVWSNRLAPEHVEYLCMFVVQQSHLADKLDISLKTVINDHYGYPTHEFKGGTMKGGGIYTYPEDPDLYPLCEIQTKQEIIYMYEHEMLGIRNKTTDEYYVTRVD